MKTKNTIGYLFFIALFTLVFLTGFINAEKEVLDELGGPGASAGTVYNPDTGKLLNHGSAFYLTINESKRVRGCDMLSVKNINTSEGTAEFFINNFSKTISSENYSMIDGIYVKLNEIISDSEVYVDVRWSSSPSGGEYHFTGNGYMIDDSETYGHSVQFDIILPRYSCLTHVGGAISIWSDNNNRWRSYKLLGNYTDSFILWFGLLNKSVDFFGGFIGTLITLDNGIKVLRGNLSGFEGRNWYITGSSSIDYRSTMNVNLTAGDLSNSLREYEVVPNETIINVKSIDSDFSIYPMAVKNKKILGFIPIGKKEVELEITNKNQILKRKIAENGEIMVDWHKVFVTKIISDNQIRIGIQ